MTKLIITLAALSLGLTARADFVDFNESDGSRPNGWLSGDSANVQFFDTGGSDLFIYTGLEAASGQTLLAGWDDTSGMRMVFSQDYLNISFVFGNDHPGVISPTDLARLMLYNNGNLVATVDVVNNYNDLGDQSIGSSGVAFDEATFFYVTQGGAPINLTEAIDNLSFDGAQQPVPEAHQYATVLGACLIGLHALRRRKAA